MKTTYRAMKNGKMTNFTVSQDKIQEFLSKYPDAALVQSGTVSTGIGEKSIQTSKFENAPGLSEFPAVDSKAFKEAKPKKVADYFNRKLKDDGWDFEVDKEYLVAEAPNGESERFLLNAPKGFKVNEDGSISSAGMISLRSSMKLSTQDDIREFINNNQLDLQGNIELDNKRYKVQKFLSDNFESEFNNLMIEEDLTNITQNAKSSIAELEEQNPQLFDEIRSRIVKRYEEKFGTTESLTDYQIEDLFINVTSHLKSKQLRKSSHLVEEVKKNYEDGWAMNGTTVQDMIDQDESRLENEVLTSNEQSLRRKIKSHEQKLNYLKELESKEDFDENDPEYLHWKKAVEDDELYLKDELKKIYPEGGRFYVDDNGKQIDQVYAETSDDLEFEAYDITDQVNQHVESILEANEGEDKATVKQKLTTAYEDDAFERSLFLNHIEGTTVNLKWHSGMSVNDYGEEYDRRDDFDIDDPKAEDFFARNEFAFRNQLKRLGYSYKPGEDITGITVSDIIDNWGVFSKYLDGAYVNDGTARWNYLGDEIDQKDVGGYIKATKDMSIDMIARDRAWAQLHLLNIDPSSYKRSKKDLYLSSLINALPGTDKYMLADAKERTADNFRGGAYSGDQRISNANILIDEVNQELEEKNEAPIKISKAFSDKLELDSAERFWQGAGGFTPMLAEFAVVGGIAKGAMSLTGAAGWLNKMRSGLYYSNKTKQFVSAANVTNKAAKAGKTVDVYAKGMGLVRSRFNSAWGNGLFHLSYGLLEEGKMQMLDPLFGTEMPLGSGLGFYFGGTAARAAMPFKFGHATSKAWQRIGSAVNPISEKVIKGGIGGAVAAEVALPMEQLLAGHKSWKRWKEETYPDMDVVQDRFVDNLALFGALGFTHMKWIDARFMVGKGRSSVEKWNKKAKEFQKISGKGGEVGGKKYTAEEAKNEMFKYAELVGQGMSFIRASELIPQMQSPIGQKKMLDSQLEAIKQDAIKSTGKSAFEYEVTTDGKNFEGREEPAYWTEIDGKSVIRIDARKIIDGQIPHEVWHHITMHHLAKGKKDGRVAAELAELSARIKEYINKAVKEATEGDVDFKKFIEKEYDGVWSKDAIGEIPAQLIEMMASSRGYDLFVSNNLISDIAFELSRWSEKIFTDAKGNTKGRWAGKLLQPKLDLSDPKTVIDYLARLSTGIKGGEYNVNVINRLKKMFDGMKLADGKVIKEEKNGSETTVSTNSANIAEQIRLKDSLKPIIENYKKQVTELNNQRSKGDITNAKYNELRDKYLKEYQEKKEALTGNLIEIRDADDKDLRANSITEKNIQKEKATKLEGWKDQIDAKYDGKKYTDLYNKYIKEGKKKEEAERLVKEEWQGSREQSSVAESIWNSAGLKNSISNSKTLLGSGSEGGKIVEDYQGQFHEDVMAEINKRFSKHYNPGKINEKYGRALTPWEWLTTGHRSGRSQLYRSVGDAAKKHGTKLPTVKVEATEGGWTAFEGHTASSGYMKSSKPTGSVAEQTGIELSKSLEGMNNQVDGKRLGDVIDQKTGSDAKNLNWEARGAKDIVSYKNIAKNAKETIGKEVHLDYFGIEAEMYKKMNKSAAQQLNAGDIKSIVDVIKGDIANHLAMLPLWKQHILDPVSGENVAFEVVAGKFKSEPKATGVTTSVLKNPLLYKEIVQTGTKGNKYERSDRLKEYHKTESTEVKEAFEQDVIRSLTEGKNRAEISGILKGWMTQMEKALYVQGVNKALPNIPELTIRYKLIEMVNQISAGKSPELASQAIVQKLLKTMEAEGKNNNSDLLPILRRDEFKKEFDQKDIDKVYNAIELNKEGFISREEAKANKAKEQKIAESAKAASVKHIDKLEKENLESIVESLNELGFDVQVSDVEKANANSMQSAKWYSDKTVDWSDKPIKVIKRENIKAFQEWAGKFFRQLPREFGITFAKNMIGDPLQGRKNGFWEEANGKLRLVRNTDPILDLNKIWEANIGKDVNPAFKGLTGKIASGSKIAKAYTKAREMAEADDLQGGLDLLEKVVTKLDQAEKRGLYQALGRAQEAMLRNSKNKQEYIDGMTFVFDVAKNNANATEGERILTTFLSARLAVGESIGIENPIIKEFIDKGWVKDKANAYLKKNAKVREKNEKDIKTKIEEYVGKLSKLTSKDYSEIGGREGPRPWWSETKEEYAADVVVWEQKKDAVEKLREKESKKWLDTYTKGDAATKRRLEKEAGAPEMVEVLTEAVATAKAEKDLLKKDRTKVEHYKSSLEASFDKAFSVIQLKWSTEGSALAEKYLGGYSTVGHFDIIDLKGLKTNPAGIARMAYHRKSLKDTWIYNYETGKFTGKNMEDLLIEKSLKQLRDFGVKVKEGELKQNYITEAINKFLIEPSPGMAELVSQTIKNKKNIERKNKADKKILKKVGLEGLASKDIASTIKNIDKAMELARKRNKKARGISVFDFDETVGISDNYVIATKGGKTKRISSAEWPFLGDKMLKEGWEMDFSDFNRVTDGKPGPLMQKMKNQIKKYGAKDVFILTARAHESQKAIHDYLKSEGIDIPIENITGLGNSTGEAKAMWMLEKYAKGYNDMYFVDDALPNVKAVKKVLDQLDIKSKVQQALASQNISAEINKMLEHSLDVKAEKRFSKAEAKVRGANIKRRRIFMTDSAADLELLLEPLYGKGKEGVENKKWFGENFIKHFERGYNDINNAKQKAANEYMSLRKQNKDVVKSLDKEVPGTGFTTDMAVRVYLWNKNGIKIPDLAKGTEKKLVDHIKNDPKLQAFAENTGRIAKIKDPSSSWWAETIASEVSDLGLGTSRSKFLADWINAKNEIFSEENLNKMESKLGSNWRKNLEDMFWRMESGQTRRADLGSAGNKIMDYLNGSVGTIMHFNTRSATLQLISSINFVNHGFNNPLAAARAFANQPQYWKDFLEILNSDMLIQRRAGLKINVTEAELAAAAAGSKSPAKAVIAKILKAGYLPTKVCDSFAIASGGATYYRNAIRKYMKEGMSEVEAKKKAWIEFQAIAERTQQSSRPDLLSAQQVSWGGRIVLPFANTPMQMNRIMMKELLDLKNGRYKGFYGDGSFTNKMSKVGYYGFVQSLIFAGLQSGLFALIANSDDDELKVNKAIQTINTMADSFLRGMGIPGAVLSGVKNAVLEFQKQNKKDFRADYDEVGEDLLNISPTIGSKFGKFDAAGNTYMYNKEEILEEGLTLDGPALEGLTMVTEALLNLPVNRAHRKITNIQAALDDQNEAWQRLLVGLGWSKWDVGVGQREKAEEKVEKDAQKKIDKEKRKKEKQEAIKNFKDGDDLDKDGIKEYKCRSITKSGKRCKNRTENKNKKCYAHQ